MAASTKLNGSIRPSCQANNSSMVGAKYCSPLLSIKLALKGVCSSWARVPRSGCDKRKNERLLVLAQDKDAALRLFSRKSKKAMRPRTVQLEMAAILRWCCSINDCSTLSERSLRSGREEQPVNIIKQRKIGRASCRERV